MAVQSGAQLSLKEGRAPLEQNYTQLFANSTALVGG